MTVDTMFAEDSEFGRWLIDIVERKHGAKLLGYKVEPMGPDAAVGYMSIIKRIVLDWEKEDRTLPKSVVVKRTSASAGADAINGAMGHQEMPPEEVARMELLQKIFHDVEVNYLTLFSETDDLTVKAPEIYGAKKSTSDTPAIVMKDYKGGVLVDLIDGFNEKQLFAIVDQLVELHYLSLTTEKYKEIKPSPEHQAILEGFIENLKVICSKLSEGFPGLFDKIPTLFEKTFGEDPQFMHKRAAIYMTGERPGVLNHGDLWCPQVLWDGDEISVIVDWQAVRFAGPVDDLLHMLSTCTSVKNRRELLPKLLDHYHEKLTKKVEAVGKTVPYTRDDLEEEIKYSSLTNVFWTIFANAFWANSLLKPKNGDDSRLRESFTRCIAFIDDVFELQGW